MTQLAGSQLEVRYCIEDPKNLFGTSIYSGKNQPPGCQNTLGQPTATASVGPPLRKIKYINKLLRNKKFMLDEMPQQNASKLAIFLEYENPRSFFHFMLLFSSYKCPGLRRHRQGHSLENKIKQHEMRNDVGFQFSYPQNLANFDAFC